MATLWGYVKEVLGAVIMFGAVVGAIGVIITQTKAYKNYQERKRLRTCPIAAEFRAEIENNKQLGVQALGGQIIMICDRGIYKGYLTDLQRSWLIENFTLYTKNGGNGVVKDYYDRAMKLPTKPYEEE